MAFTIRSVRLLGRRDALRSLSFATAAAALPSCEQLVLPPSGAPGEWPSRTANDRFYVTSYRGTQEVDGDAWRLRILDGETVVGEIDYASLLALPARDKEHTLQCIGSSASNLAIGNAIWSGLPLVEVWDLLGIPRPNRPFLRFRGADDYHTGLPAEDVDRPMWLVWRMNGEPLPPEHGFPARLLVPGRYGTKNPKWVTEIAFIDEPHVGFWENRLWSDDATYRAMGMILSPAHGTATDDSAVRLLGAAFAGSDPISEVQVRTDRGDFIDATITYAPGPDIWTLWSFDHTPPGPGTYRYQVFVRTESGATCGLEPRGTDPLGGYDGGMEIEVEFQ